jgi:hypothetical protein
MSRLTVFTSAAVLLMLTATPAAFAREHHRVNKAQPFTSEQFRSTNVADVNVSVPPSDICPGGRPCIRAVGRPRLVVDAVRRRGAADWSSAAANGLIEYLRNTQHNVKERPKWKRCNDLQI